MIISIDNICRNHWASSLNLQFNCSNALSVSNTKTAPQFFAVNIDFTVVYGCFTSRTLTRARRQISLPSNLLRYVDFGYPYQIMTRLKSTPTIVILRIKVSSISS